jgi:hypothetical protein
MPGNGASLFGAAQTDYTKAAGGKRKLPNEFLPAARTKFTSVGRTYNFADSSLPALNLATFLAFILITAPV